MHPSRAHISQRGQPRVVDARALARGGPPELQLLDGLLQIQDDVGSIIERQLGAVCWKMTVRLLVEVGVEA